MPATLRIGNCTSQLSTRFDQRKRLRLDQRYVGVTAEFAQRPANTICAGKVGIERRNSIDTPVGDANMT